MTIASIESAFGAAVVGALVAGYVLGSIPFGLMFGWLAGAGDVRNIGSGNIGATNVLRTGKRWAAAATLICDAAKGAIAVLAARHFGAEAALAAGFGAENAADASASTPDVLLGVSASGRTPYVLGALLHARDVKALRIGLACVAGSPFSKITDIMIEPVTGPEVITGSTRMKAGTATKMVLNMISTGVMVRTGHVYGNLMVNVKPTNEKLIDRAQRIIMTLTGCDRPAATRLMIEAGDVKTAIAMQKLSLSRTQAEARLAAQGGNLGKVLRAQN